MTYLAYPFNNQTGKENSKKLGKILLHAKLLERLKVHPQINNVWNVPEFQDLPINLTLMLLTREIQAKAFLSNLTNRTNDHMQYMLILWK